MVTINYNQPYENYTQPKRHSGMGIASFIISIIVLIWVVLPLAVLTLSKDVANNVSQTVLGNMNKQSINTSSVLENDAENNNPVSLLENSASKMSNDIKITVETSIFIAIIPCSIGLYLGIRALKSSNSKRGFSIAGVFINLIVFNIILYSSIF